MTNSDRPNIDNFLVGQTKNTWNLVVTFYIFWSFSTIATKFWPDFDEFHEKRKKHTFFVKILSFFENFWILNFENLKFCHFLTQKMQKFDVFCEKTHKMTFFVFFKITDRFECVNFMKKVKMRDFDHFLIIFWYFRIWFFTCFLMRLIFMRARFNFPDV